eukprot:COSAG06_NODE_13492_length_1252_cov_2.040763_1_plen_326_part_10
MVQDQLELKYNTALDEEQCRVLLSAHTGNGGVWPDAVGAKINELGARLKLKALAPRPELYQLRVTGAKVTDFARLCADGIERDGLAFSVAVIQTSTEGHGLHSVATHKVMQRPAGPVILAKNSWGGRNPRWEVTHANYNSHYTFDVEIVACWSSANELTVKPEVTEAYRGILRENQDKVAHADDLRRQKSAAERNAEQQQAKAANATRRAEAFERQLSEVRQRRDKPWEEGEPPEPEPEPELPELSQQAELRPAGHWFSVGFGVVEFRKAVRQSHPQREELWCRFGAALPGVGALCLLRRWCCARGRSRRRTCARAWAHGPGSAPA